MGAAQPTALEVFFQRQRCAFGQVEIEYGVGNGDDVSHGRGMFLLRLRSLSSDMN